MKKLLLGVLVLAVLAVALFVWLILRFDPEALGAQVIAKINQQSGIQLTAEKFSLHPLRGLELIDARAVGRVDSGQVEAEVTLVRMKHRVLPLLKGDLVVDEILLQEPVIELVTISVEELHRRQASKGAGRKAGRESAAGRDTEANPSVASLDESAKGDEHLQLSIETLAIENGSMTIRTPDRQEVNFLLEELHLLLRDLTIDPNTPSSTVAISGSGRLSTGRIVYGDLEALESKGEIRIAGGTAELTELNVHSANSDLMISELTVLLSAEPPSYQLAAAGGLDLNGILEVEGPEGFGRVALVLEGEGEGPELAEMIAGGVLTLNAGSIPGIESVLQIENLVGQPLLTGRKYEQTEIDYEIKANRVSLAPFEIVGEGANIGGSGEIDLAGPLALDVFIRIPRRSLDTESLTEEELASLDEQDGLIRVPFEISGTIDDPDVNLTLDGLKELATDAARSWAEEALDEAKKRAAEWLKSQSDNRDDG